MIQFTNREKEILNLVRTGTTSPTDLAGKLQISQSGASQALQKLAGKGKLVRKKQGRAVTYELMKKGPDTDNLYFLFQAYNSLSQVWAYLMSKKLSSEELSRARQARDVLEKILAKKQK
jgi:DNA-binding MarR family transcriptional regulator